MNKEKIIKVIIGILCLVIFLEILRSSTRENADFMGYVNAGNLVLEGKNIYSDYLNTWPPFFSVFSVPLALLEKISGHALRFIWLIGSILALFGAMRISIKWLDHKHLVWPFQQAKASEVSWSDSLVLIPFLLTFRFVLDNLANVQINMYMLLMSLLVIDLFIKRKEGLAGMILAFSISLKVYTIFLLLYFLYKREFKIVSWTFIFLFLFNSLSLFVFGPEQALTYYSHWYQEIASPFATIQHKNQSFFSMLRSWFTNDSPGLSIYVNFINLPIETLKKVAYGILSLAAIYPAWLFRKKLENRKSKLALLEYTFILTAIPILSPIAWKAYFIFLWMAHLWIFYYLYRLEKMWSKGMKNVLKTLLGISVILNTFSTDATIGRYYSDVMEVYSCITIGTIILLLLLLCIYNRVIKTP